MKKILLLFILIAFQKVIFAQTNIPTGVSAPASVSPKVLPSNSDPSKYYQRVFVPILPIVDSGIISVNSSVDSILTSTLYFDELHRPIQKVIKQASPLKNDNVSVMYYDEFGRPSLGFLPYTSQTGNNNDGKFKFSSFNADSTFYKSNFPNEQAINSQNIYDVSPLARVIKAMAPGNSWAGSNIGTSYNWRSNNLSDSVVLFTIATSSEDDVAAFSGYYTSGSLFVQQSLNEKGISTIQYSDENGRLIMSKTQVSNSPSTGHYGWLCTYYVYDELNHLRVVITPKAVDALNNSSTNWNLSANPQINTNLCYEYFYNNRGKVVMKRIPGKGKLYIAYDLFDRAVMSQDANLRNSNLWSYVLYDLQNRTYETGLRSSALSKDNIFSQASTYPNSSLPGTVTSVLSQLYYDDYAWTSGTPVSGTLEGSAINSANFNTTYNAAPEYAQQILMSSRIKGKCTGVKKLILNSSTYLYTVTIYDENGRPVQIKETNYTGGTDVATIQYSFSSRKIRTYLAHSKQGTNAQSHSLLTKYSYDHIGRIKSITKNIDNLGDKIISQETYNELGQLSSKVYGNSAESQTYSYNIRGWLSGINDNYVAANNSTNYFGESLSFDFGFTNNQLTGAIAGIKWRAAGDQTARAYGFTYDNGNRLQVADFSQQNAGSTLWTKDKVDYTTNGLSYDGNGNILSMNQKGLQVGSSTTIDSLTYQYFPNSNQLQVVSDAIKDPSPMGDFKDTTAAGDHYSYDLNGNIIKDLNRHLHTAGGSPSAVFNFLDRPDSIGILNNSGTYYTYDISGILLKKVVSDYTGASNNKTYLYINGFVYLNDTLQYVINEEGRIRYAQKINNSSGALYYSFDYDYFLKDHLGNIRTVITEGRDTVTYQATMESANSAIENKLFSNIYSPNNTVSAKPSQFDNNNSNQNVSLLDGTTNKKVGPSIVLKVMAGDRLQINTFAYYNSTTQAPPCCSGILNDILSVLPTGVTNNSGGKLGPNNSSALSNILSSNVNQFLQNGRSYDNSRPKAYLNWILFDDQFNYVASNSGVQQVLPGSSKQALVAPLQNISTNGYLYVYVSNESPQQVYFDDVTVTHYTGALLQEQSFYPFGLQMSGISDRAALKTNNSYKYNGGTELEEDGGLNYYNTFFRKYDQQIGRFTGVDILSEASRELSPYRFGADNPISFNDPSGARENFDNTSADGIPRQHQVSLWAQQGAYSEYGELYDNTQSGGGGGDPIKNESENPNVAKFWQTVIENISSGYWISFRYEGEYIRKGENKSAWEMYSYTLGKPDNTGSGGVYVFNKDENALSKVDNSRPKIESNSSIEFNHFTLGVTMAMDVFGFAAAKAKILLNIVTGTKLPSKVFKSFTRSGSVIGAIAGGIPAIISMKNGVNRENFGAVAFALLGVFSEFTGLGEAYDGTIGLGIAAGSLGLDVYEAFKNK